MVLQQYFIVGIFEWVFIGVYNYWDYLLFWYLVFGIFGELCEGTREEGNYGEVLEKNEYSYFTEVGNFV